MIKNIVIVGIMFLLGACSTVSEPPSNTNRLPRHATPMSTDHDIGNSLQAQSEDIPASLTENQKTELIIFSMSLLDTKYNWGGKKPDFGLDCSGLISYVFNKSINLNLRGAAKDLVKKGASVPLSHAKNQKLEPGDLLFFNTTGKPYSHVGLYIGKSKFLHASSGQKKVVISNINTKYFIERLEEIKRI